MTTLLHQFGRSCSSLWLGLILAITVSALSPVSAAVMSWSHQGGNWSTSSNWSPTGSPTDQDIVFTAYRTSYGIPSSTVDQNFTINSLSYTNTGTTATNWQVTQINQGVTLTINNVATAPSFALLVGGNTTNQAYTTNAQITGLGALVVNESSSTIQIDNSAGYANLDLSGLSTFTATVSQVNMGILNGSQGVFTLASANSITAASLSVGDSRGNNSGSTSSAPSTLNLGATNTLHIDNIYVGAASTSYNRSSGLIQFQSGQSGTPTVVLRGQSGGTSRTNLTVGDQGNDGKGNIVAVADFTLGNIDARIDNLIIARGLATADGNNRSATGTFSMSAGNVDVTSATVGITIAGGGTASTASGTLNISGGTFTAGSLALASNVAGSEAVAGTLNVSGTANVQVNNGIVMGVRSSAASVTPTILLTGGTLTVNGDIAEGAGAATVNSTVTLNGGTLDLNGHILSVDSFNAQSGTLKNVSQLNAPLVKTTSGTLILAGHNTYTASTQVNAGTLLINADQSTATGTVTVAAAATLGGNGHIGGNTTITGGSLTPGDSAGTISLLNFDASLTLSGSTTNTTIQISGLGRGLTYDAIDVAGVLTLDGALLFDVTGTLELGSYSIFGGTLSGGITSGLDNITIAGMSGSVQLVNDHGIWMGIYEGKNLTFSEVTGQLNVVPEPASLSLIGVASFLLLYRSRKRPMS